MYRLPPALQTLIWLNVAVYFLDDALFDHALAHWLALYSFGPAEPGTPGFEPWQLLTYGFIHGGFLHLFVNLFGLAMFGGDVERAWGSRRFVAYYFVCVLAAGLTQEAYAWLAGAPGVSFGASGGLFGVLLAFAVLFPQRRIVLLVVPLAIMLFSPYPMVGAFGGVFALLVGAAVAYPRRWILLPLVPVPMPARLFVTLYGLAELFLGVTGTQAGVAHFAHLGGLLGGWLMIRYAKLPRPVD